MADTAVLKAQVMRGVAWASATRIAGQMLNWVITLTVVRFLVPSDYGLMAITMAVTGFLAAMSYVGFSDVLVQSRDADAAAGEAFGLILLANLAFLVILFASAPAIAGFYHDPRLIPLLRVVSFSFILLAAASLSRAKLQRELALKQMSAVDMASNLAGGLTTILLAWRGFGVWALLDGYMLAETVRTIGFLILAPMRHWPALPSRRQSGLMRLGSTGRPRTCCGISVPDRHSRGRADAWQRRSRDLLARPHPRLDADRQAGDGRQAGRSARLRPVAGRRRPGPGLSRQVDARTRAVVVPDLLRPVSRGP